MLRALAMEQLIEAVDLERECMYIACDHSASREALKLHEKVCLERPVRCPEFTCCSKILALREVIDHLQEKTSRNYVVAQTNKAYKNQFIQSTDIFTRKDTAYWDSIDILNYEGKEFLPAFAKRNGVYYAWVYILADPGMLFSAVVRFTYSTLVISEKRSFK